jgi:hypothetical protein
VRELRPLAGAAVLNRRFGVVQRIVYDPTPLGFARLGDGLISDEREASLVVRVHALRVVKRTAAALNAGRISGRSAGLFYASG